MDVESALGQIWNDVLHRTGTISNEEAFDSLGGDSIMMMMMMIRISKTFGVELSPEQIYADLTLGGVARVVREALQQDRDVQSNAHSGVI